MNLLEDILGSFLVGIFLLGTLISLCGKGRDPGGGRGKERKRKTQSRAAPQTKDLKERIQKERAQLEKSQKGEEQSSGVATGSHASEKSPSEKEPNVAAPHPKQPSEKEIQMISERVPTKDEKAPSREEKEKEGPSQSGASAATSGAQPPPPAAETPKISPPAKEGQQKEEEKESDSDESDEESVKKAKKKKKKHSKKKSKKRSKKRSSKKEKKREKKKYYDQSKDNNSLDKPEKVVYPYALVPAKKQKTSRTVDKGLTTKINDLLMTENNELGEAETQMMSGQTNAPNPSEMMQLDKTQALSLQSPNPMMKLDPTQNPTATKCLTGVEAPNNNNNGYEELPLLSVQPPPGEGEDGTPHEETAASTNRTSAEKVKVLMATLGPAEGADGNEKKPTKKSPIEPIDPINGGSLFRTAPTLKSVNTTQTQQATELQTGVTDGVSGGEKISMVQETQPTITKICTKSTMPSFPNSSDVVLSGVDATQPSKTRDAALLAPQVFPKGAKAERISKFGLRRNPAEYPTGSDVKSDWTPTSGSGIQNGDEVDLRRSPVAKNDPNVPRVIPKSAKAERIAQYGLRRGGAEYPTFGDIRSDWTSTEGAAVPSKYKKENDYTKFENDPTKKKAAAPAKDSEKMSKREKEALKQSKREKDPSEKKKKASPLPESSPNPEALDPKLQEEERIKKLRAAAPKPKKFKRTPYEEKIAQGIIVRKKQDYPTMGDVISDWESENSSTSQMDHHQQQHPQEHHHGAAKTPKKAKDSDKQH